MSKPRSRVHASSTTNTYFYCWKASTRALKRAEAQEKPGCFCDRMVAGVFAAFAVEAFLNHIGQQKMRDWASLERRLSPRDKLLRLRQVAHWSVDKRKRPFSTLLAMKRLRDALAHGKTLKLSANVPSKELPRDTVTWPEPEWKTLCSPQKVRRMVEDAEEIIRNLAKQSGMSRDPLFSPGHSWSGESAVDE